MSRGVTAVVTGAAILSLAFVGVIVATAVDGRSHPVAQAPRTTAEASFTSSQPGEYSGQTFQPTEDPQPAPPPTTTYLPPPPPPSPLPDPTAQFGQIWAWEDGMAATVVSATPFQFSSYYVDDYPNSQGIAVTVTFTNNSPSSIDITFADVSLRFGSAGVSARQVFDSGANFGEPVEGMLAPGQSATGSYGFAVTLGDESILSVSVRPSFDYEEALFSGAAG